MLISKKKFIWKKEKKADTLTELLQENSKRGFLTNLTLILLLPILLVIVFFFFYLPSTTNFGETLTVPDARGMTYTEANTMFASRDLRSEVIDSVFTNQFPPDVVISQSPKPNQLAKVNRTIYLVVNAHTAPNAQIPNVIGSLLPNAKQQLQSFGFRLGNINYVSHPQTNQVLSISIEGVPIGDKMLNEGYESPKSQAIDLVVADGIGNIELKLPDLKGMPLDEAEIYLLGLDLQIGNIRWLASDKPYGTVLSQSPKPNSILKLNESVDLWVAKE